MRHRLVVIFTVLTFVVIGLVTPSAQAAGGLTPSQVQKIVNDVKGTLTAISFDSPEVLAQIAPTYFPSYQITNKKIEIFRSTGTPINQISNEEAIRALQTDYLSTSGYQETFQQIQQNLDQYLGELLLSDSTQSTKDVAQYTEAIRAQPVQLLLGLTYIQRLFDFDYGQFNFAHALRTSGSFGKAFSPLSLALSIGSQNGDQYAMPKNVETFTRLIAGVATDATTLDAFITAVVPTADAAAWYVEQMEQHGNIVEETPSASLPHGVYTLYGKLTTYPALTPYLLPLLSRTNSEIFVLSNVSSIGWGMRESYVANESDLAAMAQFQDQVAQYAQNQASYIDFWARMLPDQKNDLITGRIVNDGYFVQGRGSGQAAWSPRMGATAAEAVTDFFAPMNRWYEFKRIGAEATGQNISLWLARLLSASGNSAYSHELTHQLDADTYLKDFGVRAGTSAELLPRGLFETLETDEPIYALNQIMDWPTTGYANSSPALFQDETAVHNYMRNLLDVTTTLDIIEAEEVLSRDTAAKQRWFNTVTLTPNTAYAGAWNENFIPSTQEQAASWKSIDDLVEANAVVARYEAVGLQTTGTANYNGYHTIPLFSPLFGAPTSPTGVTGDVHMRRIAWQLLADYGYSDGLVPYLSNQYNPGGVASRTAFADSEIIRAITPHTTSTDLRKAAFNARSQRLNDLQPISITWQGRQVQINDVATLRELMTQAVTADLTNTPLSTRARHTQVEQLKSAVYLAYKAQTSEFNTSIYRASLSQAQRWSPTSQPLTRPFGHPLSHAEILAAVDSPAPSEAIHTFEVTGPIPTQGHATVQVSITYTDGSVDTVDVPVTFGPEADNYPLQAADITTDIDQLPEARSGLSSTLPATAHVEWAQAPAVSTPGTAHGTVRVTFSDGSTHEIVVTVHVRPAPTFTVTYTVTGETPADAKPVPEDPTAYRNGETITLQDVPTTTSTTKDGVPGRWRFVGWLLKGNTVNAAPIVDNADIALTGSWVFVPHSQHMVTFTYAGPTNGPSLPPTMTPPTPITAYEATMLTFEAPRDVEDPLADGVWSFDAWTPSSLTLGTNDVTVEGRWSFTPREHTVTYRFTSSTDRALPQTILAQLPLPLSGKIKGNIVTSPSLETPRIQDEASNGVWTFDGWDRDQVVMDTADVTVSGRWRFSPLLSPLMPIGTVTPIAPTVSDPTSCTVIPYVDIPASAAVDYLIDGAVTSPGRVDYGYGRSITVVAQPRAGYSLAQGAPAQWTWNAPTREELGCSTGVTHPPVPPSADHSTVSGSAAHPQDAGKSNGSESDATTGHGTSADTLATPHRGTASQVSATTPSGGPTSLATTGTPALATASVSILLLFAGITLARLRQRKAAH
ncbi:ZmpA/ZmpB/ZmpC family metallo-endopeptidase [Schaalia suimastitidis]|uniref:ZmpA/ZmpB/ZmpC family metallo-endopeptidase n=1 Tax=Schaalia suimastitidis TaxID=121163 RepID=UPI000427F39D|nr:ZmpA/ZmpB/ZmpC family metallo-endopeptidase [Schaalia suimastitidis]